MTTYTVLVTHDDHGLSVSVHDVGDSADDRMAVAWALREAAEMVEDGIPMDDGTLQ